MIALLAIALPVLIGATGLVLDTGALYDLRRRTQAAADAAADAAAQEVRLQTGAESVKSAAVYDAKKNGFVDDKTTSIEVNQPPKLGHYKGNKNYVEVIITDEAPTFFMTALTDKHYDVRGRAVASVATNNICTWTLDPSASLSFDASGSAAVSFKDCGVFVNSNNSKAARTTGKATVSAPSINVVGNYTGSAFSPTPTTGASAITDPFAEVANPVVGSTCSYTNKTVKSAETLTPGTYCGGLTLNAKANATLKGGLYVLKGGGLTVNGQATMTGAGVTFLQHRRQRLHLRHDDDQRRRDRDAVGADVGRHQGPAVLRRPRVHRQDSYVQRRRDHFTHRGHLLAEHRPQDGRQLLGNVEQHDSDREKHELHRHDELHEDARRVDSADPDRGSRRRVGIESENHVTVANGRVKARHEAASRHRRERGGAVAELAVAMPFVFMMMVGAVDFGRMWTVSTRVADAAYAGAAYGAQSTTTAKDTSGMRTVALHELGIDPVVSTPTKKAAVAVVESGKSVPSEKDYDVTTTRYCECEDKKSVDCDKGTCVVGSGNRRMYVQVRVGTTFQTVFDYPGIPHEVTITRQTRMRAR